MTTTTRTFQASPIQKSIWGTGELSEQSMRAAVNAGVSKVGGETNVPPLGYARVDGRTWRFARVEHVGGRRYELVVSGADLGERRVDLMTGTVGVGEADVDAGSSTSGPSGSSGGDSSSPDPESGDNDEPARPPRNDDPASAPSPEPSRTTPADLTDAELRRLDRSGDGTVGFADVVSAEWMSNSRRIDLQAQTPFAAPEPEPEPDPGPEPGGGTPVPEPEPRQRPQPDPSGGGPDRGSLSLTSPVVLGGVGLLVLLVVVVTA